MTHWARQYLGQPWVSGESDCYALVRRVYREVLGVELPLVDVTQAEPVRLRRLMEAESITWDAVQYPRELDVVMMSHGARPHHVGLWTDADGGRVVHSLERTGVVAPSLLGLTMGGWRVLGFYRRVTQ